MTAKPLVSIDRMLQIFKQAGITISKRTVQNKLYNGTFPIESLRYGRKVYFRRTDIDKHIQEIIKGDATNGKPKNT